MSDYKDVHKIKDYCYENAPDMKTMLGEFFNIEIAALRSPMKDL